MSFSLNRIGQIALAVGDVDVSEAFYKDLLRLRHLYRFGELTFFDCSGLRLLIEKATSAENIRMHPPYTSAVLT